MVQSASFDRSTGVLLGALLVAFALLAGCAAQEPEEPAEPTEEVAVEEPAEPEPEPEPAEEVQEDTEPEPEPEPELEMPVAVQDYVELARQPYSVPEGDAKYDHDYTAERLSALGEALVALGGLLDGSNSDLRNSRKELNRRAEAIQTDPMAETHADDARAAFLEATSAFRTLTERMDGSSGDLTEVQRRAEAIDPDVLYLEQKGKGEAFFFRTADLVQSMFEDIKAAHSGN